MAYRYAWLLYKIILQYKLPFLIVGIYAFANCHKKNHDNICPVNYTLSEANDFALTGKWKFIGFEDQSTSAIEYQPCGNNEVHILFEELSHNRQGDENFLYPYIFKGQALVNSYTGSYNTSNVNHITFSQTIKSKINGTREVEQFEEKYHQALLNAETFTIVHNLLLIFYEDGTKNMLFVRYD